MIEIDDKYDVRWGDPAKKWSGKEVREFLQGQLKLIIRAVNKNETDIVPKTELKEVKYADLVQLRKEGKLGAGNLYRITDYATTVANDSEARSAGHPFDVIVLALSKNTLSEEAMAIQSSRDSGYFDKCHLSAWKLWYCLDNDSDRFQWADKANGKGVIYRLIDEWGNDCPYDFKNIQFRRCRVTSTAVTDLNNTYVGMVGVTVKGLTNVESDIIWCYTFSQRRYNGSEDYDWIVDGDLSLLSAQKDLTDDYGCDWEMVIPCHDNIIKPCSTGDNKFVLNNIVFLDGWCNDENDYEPVTKTSGNTFGENCYNFTFLGLCYENSFGSECYSNAFAYYCRQNTFQNLIQQNSFGNYCYRNTFGNGLDSNTFGNSVGYNTFGNNVYNNTFGNYCYYNTFGNNCWYNTFGNYCRYNTFGNVLQNNTFGNSVSSNTFGNYCYYNTFGNSVYNNTFGNDVYNNTFGNNFQYNSVGNGVQYISILTEKVYYAHILDGTKGTGSNNKLTISLTADKKSSQYAGLNSSGTLKIWVPADVV